MNDKQTIRIHIFPTTMLSFEIDADEKIIYTEVLTEFEVGRSFNPERLILVTTNKQ